MTLVRPQKKKRQRRFIQGDRNMTSPARSAEVIDFSSADFIESLYDDELQLNLLEQNEDKLKKAEENNSKALEGLRIPITPTNAQLIEAISTLKGEPSLVLDGRTIERALDLSFDSYIHSNGFNPVAASLGLYGEENGVPLAPVPRMYMTCEEMQKLKNVPSPGDGDYAKKKIDEISADSQESKATELLGKLWKILKYYPGLDIEKFLEVLKVSPIKKIVEKAIRWVQCNMIYPALSLLTGEVKECAEGRSNPKTRDTLLDESDLSGRGMDCLAAAGQVLNYCDSTLRNNKDVRTLYKLKEARADHEATKFGILYGSIKNRTHFGDRISMLEESTRSIPRYKKQYYDNRENYSAVKTYQTHTLDKD